VIDSNRESDANDEHLNNIIDHWVESDFFKECYGKIKYLRDFNPANLKMIEYS
jgi:hypothetical protein